MAIVTNSAKGGAYYVYWCYIGDSTKRAYFVNARQLNADMLLAYKFKNKKEAEACQELVKANNWGVDRCVLHTATVTIKREWHKSLGIEGG